MTIDKKGKPSLDVTDETTRALKRIREALVSIADAEGKAIVFTDIDGTPDWEKLRYTVFQAILKDITDDLDKAYHTLSLTEKDINEMCAEEGLTVKEAYKNATDNLKMSMLPWIIANMFPM